jgi:uncharacterized protein YceK
MKHVVLALLVLGLVGCTSVTREQIKSVVTAQREHHEDKDRDCECTVIVVTEKE